MKIFFLIATLFVMLPAQGFSDKQLLILPLDLSSMEADQWEGLAFTLALQAGSKPGQVIPITATRRKLNEYGLSLLSPSSLASRIKLAREIGADELVYGTVVDSGVHLTILQLNDLQFSNFYIPGDLEEPEMLLCDIASHLGLEPSPKPFDFYRLWSSSYFSEEMDLAGSLMRRLLESEASDWFFLQEYVDLFGSPAREVESIGDLVYWRDWFHQKDHISHALEISEHLLEIRHHPGDFLFHARLMLKTGDTQNACYWWDKAKSFGFEGNTDEALHSLCP